MDKFIASNGVSVYLDDDGDMDIDNHGRVGLCGGPVVEAIREFFRAEEDERLGRWRWPENPDLVVYHARNANGDHKVLDLSTGHGMLWGRDMKPVQGPDLVESAAHAFFEAHPEPKPWHDAKPGEVWVLRIPTGPTFDHAPAVVSSSANGSVIFTAATYDAGGTEEIALTASQITYATRIWPEGGDR